MTIIIWAADFTSVHRAGTMQEPSEISSDNIGARARSAAGWQFLSKGINTALQMATSIVLARLLMPADFGIVAMAAMVTGLAGVFSDLGLGQALVQRPEISEDHTRSAYWGTLVMAGLLYGGVYLSAPYVGAYFDEPRMIPVLKLTALSFVLSPFAVVPRSLLQRDLDFKTPFFAGVASSISYGAVGITMALLGYGYWALVFAGLAGGLVGTVALCILTRYLPPLLPTFRGIGDLYGFGTGVTATGILTYSANQIDYFIIGRRLAADDIGLYKRAYQLMTFPLALPWTLAAIIFPTFAQLQNDLERARAAFGKVLTTMTLITWPFCALLLITAPELIPVVFGTQWTAAIIPSQIMMVVAFVEAVRNPARAVIKAMGSRYVWADSWRQVLFAILLGGTAWWACRWGIQGVAWAVSAANLIYLLLVSHLLRKAIGYGPAESIRACGAALLLSILVATTSLGVRHILLEFQASAGATLAATFAGGAAVGIVAFILIPFSTVKLVRSELMTMAQRALRTLHGEPA